MYEALKRRVCEANLELPKLGLVLYTWGNVSEVDRAAGVFAIKPSGVEYRDLTEDMIVVMSLETGERVEGALNPSSDTPTHFMLYKKFMNIGGITHTHSTYATAWAQACESIPCMGTTHADYFYGDIPATRYVSKSEAESAYEAETATVIAEAFTCRDPARTPAALVAGHGPFTWGKNAAESVYHAAALEQVARVAAHTLSISGEARILPVELMDKHFSRKHGAGAYYGQK